MPHPYASVLCAVGWELSPNHHRLEGDLSRTEPRTETLSRLRGYGRIEIECRQTHGYAEQVVTIA